MAVAQGAVHPQPWQGTTLRGAPRRLTFTLVTVEVLALCLFAFALFVERPTEVTVLRLLGLAALCFIFEEISRQVGKLRLLIKIGPQPDMTSVWTFAGALVLPAGYAALLAIIVAAHMWLRQQRATGQYVYRRAYVVATVVLACLAASALIHRIETPISSAPQAARIAIMVVAAILAYTAVNWLLVILAVYLSGGSPGAAVGSVADVALELATLCLGAMTAVVILRQPELSFLVVLPMVLLQRGALTKQLEEAASTDGKTRLLNAVAWQQVAQRELVNVAREQAGAAVLIIDLDFFKNVNDRHGHLVGDAALLAVGRALKQVLRQYDIVGRFGGEEFVAMLPRIDVADALLTAERVRLSIRSIALAEFCPGDDVAGERFELSASVGVATFPAHGAEIEDLLRAADAALYLAKNAGRNRVALAGSDGGIQEYITAPD